MLNKTVALILFFLALIPAIVLTTMLLDVRSEQLAGIQDRMKKLEDSDRSLTAARNNLHDLEERIQQQVHLWGDIWNSPRTAIDPQGPGQIQVEVGTAAGLGLKEAAQKKPYPTFFAFAQNPEGATYIGEFRITVLDDNGAQGTLVRPPFPGETQTWPQGGSFRVRSTLPGSWRSAFGDLQSAQLIADAKLRTQMLELDILNKQVQVSQESLDRRLAELSGNPNPIPGSAPEVSDGLVQTVRVYEQRRNEVLAEVDQLRRTVDAEYVKLQKTLAANTEKLAKLQASLQTRSKPLPLAGTR